MKIYILNLVLNLVLPLLVLTTIHTKLSSSGLVTACVSARSHAVSAEILEYTAVHTALKLQCVYTHSSAHTQLCVHTRALAEKTSK
jgi:hypothetical protein